MDANPPQALNESPWWHIPIGPLAVGVMVSLIALLVGVDRVEAAWHGTNAATLTLALLLLVLSPLDPRTRAALAVPLFLLLTVVRWVFGSDLAAAAWPAFLCTIVFVGLGAARHRRSGGDGPAPPSRS